MDRIISLLLAAALLALLLMAILHESWGGFALVAAATVAWLWYRTRVARSTAAEQFFNDPGEETRVTGIQPGPPSEMPPPTGRSPGDQPRHRRD